MKKILFILIFFTSLETLYGQEFQAGFRTGGGVLFRDQYFDRPISQPTFSSEFSIRYESKRHFVLELGLRHTFYQCSYTETFNYDCFDNFEAGPSQTINHVQEKTNRISPAISFQYRIYKQNSYYRPINKLSASIGFQIAPCWTQRQYKYNDEPQSSFSSSNKETAIMMGLTSQLSYKLSYNWSLSCKIEAITDPWMLFDSHSWSNNNNRLYASDINFIALLGINYKF